MANALASLLTDGAVEVTLVQFSATAAVLVDALLIESPADRAFAVGQALAIDPVTTDVPPFEGGTNFEDAFEMTTAAVTGSPRFASADFQIFNMLTDGNPTTHNNLGLPDLDEASRLARARMFGKDARDDAITAGIDAISFEALGSTPADITYLETLTHPSAPFHVTGTPLVFPDPLQSQGFILEIAGVSDIEDALIAKFDAAGITPEPGTLMRMVIGAASLLRQQRGVTTHRAM
ncbi:MAG: hypothetical protein V3U29_04475 [Phycisphaeraceae bacterium]